MLIQDKIELYEKLEKYLLNEGIDIFKEEKKQIQKEITKADPLLTEYNNRLKNKLFEINNIKSQA